MKKTICILGATSHISKGLIYNFLKQDNFDLHLFSRSSDKVRGFLDEINESASSCCIIHEGYHDFQNGQYDILINCVGVGTSKKLNGDYSLYFTVTEEFDNLAISYLLNHKDTLYISVSSGAVYGRNHSAPFEENSLNCIPVNGVPPQDYYGIVRLNSEAKHRAFKHLNIVDLRIFSYFSRFIDLSDNYLMTDIINCVLDGKVLIADGHNIVRDYLHHEDLFSMIQICMNTRKINNSFDVVSAKAVVKKEILTLFASEYGLQYKIDPTMNTSSVTGFKNIYSSNYSAAFDVNYTPKYTSLAALKHETEHILLNHNKRQFEATRMETRSLRSHF